ncbi:kinesin-like protein KIF12-like [Homarus americanus]|uniref:Kinesin-like protein n=1 Tax=Homarus americanus TaxID=6706 RepID=A0A8J5MZZ7_HOMAM|nr:kinesin-like protein KIF12-like [Homarus americanus]
MVERRTSRRGDSPGSRELIRSGGSGGSEGSGLNGSRGFTGHSTLPSSNDGLGSANSLDQTMTRSLGSRGSLCDEAADECDNINVVIRCRPLNDKERQRGDENNLIFPGEGQAWVNMDGMNGQLTQKPKVFTYNVVFEPEALQEDILEHSGVKRLLDMAIDGFSCTIFCYGQTGSGKTHTLTGPPHLFDKGPDMFSESHGLIFRSFVYLFNQLQNRDDQEFTLTASYLEIYNEKVIDLLNIGTNTKPLQVRWSKKKRGFFVENLFEIECAELDDLLAVLEEGLRNRAVASHNMNEYSSRSHTILTVNITSEQKADDGVNLTRNGKINFVDLAGSEMTKKTNSEGKTLEEANNINKSLMVLGTCIAALSDNRKRDGHIPYRDSKLTKLLADSLAGNGVTLMIACVSPAKSNISETINTLRYATRAKRIRTKPIIVMDPKEKVIMSLQREVSLLREENAHLKMLIDLGENVPPPMSRQGSFRIDDEKLENLDNRELIKLVQHYMAEHENVRKENKELQRVTTALVRDQELVCKENERLLRKLEDVSRDPHSNPNAQSEDRLAAYLNAALFVTVCCVCVWVWWPPYYSNHFTPTTILEYHAVRADSLHFLRTLVFLLFYNNPLPLCLQPVFVRALLSFSIFPHHHSLPPSYSLVSVCCRSPIVPAQPAISGEELLNASMTGNFNMMSGGSSRVSNTPSFRSRSLPSSSSSQVWINPLNNSRGKDSDSGPSSRGRGAGTSRESSQRHHRLPDSINKELEKRRIGKSMTDLTTSGGSSGGRRNSWDERNESEVQRMRKIPVKSKSMSPGVATGRSGGRGKTRSKSVPRLKGGGRGGIPRGPAARDTDHRPPGPSYHGSSLPSVASTSPNNIHTNQLLYMEEDQSQELVTV